MDRGIVTTIDAIEALFADTNAIPERMLFSDFPTIVFVDPTDDFAENDWHASLDDFQVRYTRAGGALFFVHHRPLEGFNNAAPIPGPLAPEAGGEDLFLDATSIPELRRLLRRRRRPVLIFARDPVTAGRLPAN